MCGYLQADQCPHERYAGALEVDVVSVGVTQPLFCPATCRFSTRPVDLFSPLGDVGQHGDMVVTHFHVASEDRQIPSLLTSAVHQFTLTEIGEEGSMAWEDTQVTAFTWDIQLIHLFLHQDTRRRDNFHRQRHD
jgi:hypothetical protein